jgi:nucleoside-diphosphate-sugar epimerase
MRVFVAGASGVIGTPLVERLLAAGHEVTGMTRREERAERLRAAGAEAVVCDAFDAEGLRGAVAAARPEAVMHVLTALPLKLKPRSNWTAATSRVRIEGTRNLVAGARAAGARRLVAESIAFLYRPEGGWVKDEEAPVFDDAPGHFGDAYRAVADMEKQVLGAEGLDGVVLRCGFLYGPGTWYGRGGSEAENVAKRRTPVVGAGTGTFSWAHVDDVVSAFLAALGGGAPGVYNVVDDEPAPMREWLPVFAEALGAKPPRGVPAWLAKLVAGSPTVQMALETRGASNAKAKRELGWQPSHPSWRQGFAASLR